MPFAYQPSAIIAQDASHGVVQQPLGRWRLTVTIGQAGGKVAKLAIMDRLPQEQCTVWYKPWKQYQESVLFRDAQIHLG